MKVLVIGHGAREHAIAKKLAQEDLELYAAMGKNNPGITGLSRRAEIFDINKLDNYDTFMDVDLAFIGPEDPLAHGVADYLWDKGVPVVGPRKAMAKLEWSKAYTRQVLSENNIPGNPEFKICRTIEDIRRFMKDHEGVAVKPDVLTGGKGVKISGEHLRDRAEVQSYALERIKNDGLVILEEKLKGREFTLQGFTDGKSLKVMPLVRDFKRAYDNDKGPNTGSMGSFSCPDHLMPDLSKKTVNEGINIMEKTISTISKKVGEFKGVLYGGLMYTDKGVYLLEYNVRFGDPEAINVLSLLEDPLTEVGYGITEGNLPEVNFSKKATVCVYLVPEGYPVDPVKDEPIEVGDMDYSELYYASVYDDKGVIRTTGSRAIALLGIDNTVKAARTKVYNDVSKISGRLHFRTDIAKGI
jgi:phosphoribosylamine--glycine ligase